MVFAIDDPGRLSRFGGLRIADELLGLLHAGSLEEEENVVGFCGVAPEIHQSQAGVPVGLCVGRENGFPPREVRNTITTQQIGHRRLHQVVGQFAFVVFGTQSTLSSRASFLCAAKDLGAPDSRRRAKGALPYCKLTHYPKSRLLLRIVKSRFTPTHLKSIYKYVCLNPKFIHRTRRRQPKS